jgi:hypothetical protein
MAVEQVIPTPRVPERVPGAQLDERLAALQPPAAVLDCATVATGLADCAARESVARLLSGTGQR